MQYTITIRQLAVVMAGLNLDIVDMAIFDFIKDYAHSPKCMKIQTEGGQYFWVAHTRIIEELPILGISTGAGIIKRINKLIDAELLERHPNCDMMKKTFYRFGKNYDKMCFIDLNKSNEATTTVEGNPQQTFRVTPNESLGNQYTKNQSTNYQDLNNNSTADGGLFPTAPVTRERKQPDTHEPRCHFAESKFNAFADFAAQFTAPDFANVDIEYYYKAVADWSAQDDKNKKNDWIATARNFMRRDAEQKKLHTLAQVQQETTSHLDDADLRYLQMCND